MLPAIKFLFPSLSPEMSDFMHWLVRKIAHTSVYFVLGFLLYRAFCEGFLVKWSIKCAVYSMVLLIFISCIDEFHQAMNPSRTFLFSDILIDTAGGFLSLVFIAHCAKKLDMSRKDIIYEANTIRKSRL